MSQRHTAECLSFSSTMQAQYDAWIARWPLYCTNCHGWGAVGEDCACEDCVDEGKCPRCGEPGLTSEGRGDDTTGEGPCKSCGWNYDDGRPEPGPYCACPEEPW